ncbi:MAG: Ppx/GppA family phosphatase [Magnetospirillum sp. WYHS-4]
MTRCRQAGRASKPRKADGACAGRVGVVDIGSNTVRLVVYDTPTRLPFPIFNEKAQCELGRGLTETRRLNPEGVFMAMKSLARFIRLSQAMGVERLDLVATAAVREALDGPDLVAEIRRRFGLPVEVLSGEEEAKLAAEGVLSGVHGADGVLGDLGGGSLDLVELDQGGCGRHATLPLGHLRLSEAVCAKGKGHDVIARHFASVPWLVEMRNRSFYAVGGSWRAMARIFIDQIGYPLHVIDNYAIPRDDAARLVRLIGGLSRESLEKIPGVQRRRVSTLVCAAAVMGALLETVRPKDVVFSAFGMREGKLLRGLPPELQHQDPLIAACETLAERSGRFASGGKELLDWSAPLFPGEGDLGRRLRYAACLVSDIGWSEHPDYRAEIAFHRVLRLPFAGLSHADRVFLALAVFVRYNGSPDAAIVAPVRRLLDDDQSARSQVLGYALRLASTVSGGAPGLLPTCRLELNGGGTLRLVLPSDSDVFIGEAVDRRFATLARAMNLKPQIAAT